jgi:hypothetical protein
MQTEKRVDVQDGQFARIEEEDWRKHEADADSKQRQGCNQKAAWWVSRSRDLAKMANTYRTPAFGPIYSL